MSNGNLPNPPTFRDDERLTGRKNWIAFQSKVELAVGSRGLLAYLAGDISCPPNPAHSSSYVTGQLYVQATATPITSPTPSHDEWQTRDRWVASVIVNNTDDPVGLGITVRDPAAKIWSDLAKQLGSRTEQLMMDAEDSLRAEKMLEDGSFDDHLKTLRKLLKEARDLGATISDSQFRSILLNSFPETWDAVTLAVPGTTSADAVEHLESHWIKRVRRARERESEATKVKALMTATAVQASAARLQLPDNRPICTNPICGKRGHTIEKCWKKGGGAEGKGPTNWRFNRNNTPGTTPSPSAAGAQPQTTASHVKIITDPEPEDIYANRIDIPHMKPDKQLPW